MVSLLNVVDLGPHGSFRKVVYKNENNQQKLFLLVQLFEVGIYSGVIACPIGDSAIHR